MEPGEILPGNVNDIEGTINTSLLPDEYGEAADILVHGVSGAGRKLLHYALPNVVG